MTTSHLTSSMQRYVDFPVQPLAGPRGGMQRCSLGDGKRRSSGSGQIDESLQITVAWCMPGNDLLWRTRQRLVWELEKPRYQVHPAITGLCLRVRPADLD